MNQVESLLEIQPIDWIAAHVSGWVRWDGPVQATTIELRARIDDAGALAELSLLAGDREVTTFQALAGGPAASGFRRGLAELRDGNPGEDALLVHRLLDDLPILSRLAGQARMVEHPAITVPPARLPTPSTTRPEDVPGADQCEGWRADGTLVRRILDGQGRLTMPLGSPVPDDVSNWSPQPVLPPMATRRRRRMELAPTDTHGNTEVTAYFRDSYADPDGIERGLHSYQVQADVAADGTVADIGATGLILPWPECWAATRSAAGLRDIPVGQADAVARTELNGLGTCTHLTDMLRTFADVPQLQAANH